MLIVVGMNGSAPLLSLYQSDSLLLTYIPLLEGLEVLETSLACLKGKCLDRFGIKPIWYSRSESNAGFWA